MHNPWKLATIFLGDEGDKNATNDVKCMLSMANYFDW